ncbi:AAA family ATPase, partial ['Fragaria x ananassa' phyllody phytoplasma]
MKRNSTNKISKSPFPWFKLSYWLSLLILFLSGFGLLIYHYLIQEKPNKNQSQDKTEQQLEKEESEKIQKKLDELSAKLAEEKTKREELTKQDNILSKKIDDNLFEVETITTKLNEINQDLTKNFETLTKEERIQKQTEIERIQKEKNDKVATGKVLIEQRKLLHKKQSETESNISQIIQTTTNLESMQGITYKINQLGNAVIYNQANKRRIQTLLSETNDNKEKNDNYIDFDRFLDQQIIGFDGQILELQMELEAIKTNQIYKSHKNKILFKDVYGMSEEKEKLKDLIYFFKSDNSLVNFDKVRPKGYLLYGPPGTGKTFLIKALCGEVNVHFMNLIPAKFDQKYVGEGKEVLEKLWQEAESYDKTIIFIDEIDGLPNRSDENTSSVATNIVNTLLDKLDGFNRTDKKVVLMGATNNLDKIDKALRSRFSKEIYIAPIKDDKIQNFLNYLVKPYNISFHTYSYLKTMAKKLVEYNQTKRKETEKISNRDLTTLIETAYYKTNTHKSELKEKNQPIEPHEVMLPSDLDEALEDVILKTKTPLQEVEKRRQECEEQYQLWRQGIVQYLQKQDKTIVEKTWIFDRLNGICNELRERYVVMKNKIEGERKAKIEAIFDKKKIPKDLLMGEMDDVFLDTPFSEWKSYFGRSGFYPADGSLLMVEYSKKGRADALEIEHPEDPNIVKISYKGPKYLLDLDKDYFIG